MLRGAVIIGNLWLPFCVGWQLCGEKSTLHDHHQVVPVARIEAGGIDWATLNPAEAKRY
jgi:hypothetical protein